MPLTVADVAHHLNAPVPADGDPRHKEMQRALNAAVQELTRMTGLIDGPATVTARLSPTVGGLLSLPYVRLTSVVVADVYGGLLPVWRTDLTAGVVQLAPSGVSTTAVVDCTRADPWPAALETAALDWAAHQYDTQRTTLNPTADDDTALPSFALPNRVAQFARPYLLPGFA